MFAIAYNLVRLVMLEASRRQKVPLERISFIDALRWLRDAQADTELTPLVVNPSRPERLEPRVLKRRRKDPHVQSTRPQHSLHVNIHFQRRPLHVLLCPQWWHFPFQAQFGQSLPNGTQVPDV